jgi:acyl transferase domain-containing protein
MRYEPIAIVGMACRFPGAPGISEFWKLLCDGRDSIVDAPSGRWAVDLFYAPERDAPGRSFVRRAGFLADIASFDWRAFRIAPKEATAMDPQHRLLLELAWEALDDAGIPFDAVARSATGVFVGIVWNDFLRLQARRWDALDGYVAAGTPFAFAANRISYHFDLRGPSVALDGTCASSLISVHEACLSLISGESDIALAGGVNLILSPDSMVIMSKAGVLSPDARCKTLDARADGFARGEGGGLLVLRRLADVRPDDRVYAIIRGTAVSHNGRNEWIMAPSASAQSSVVREAYERAGVDPRDVGYVELHGTGFLRGDALETSALSAAIRGGERRDDPCAIGAVKTNLGNLEAAAGIASIIKVALCLQHATIPPSLNLERTSPLIDFNALGLIPQRALGPWSKSGRRIASVNVTAFSGNNGHAVLEAYDVEGCAGDARSEELALLALSAHTPEALASACRRYAEWLRGDGRSELMADVCYTAAFRRTHHRHRLAILGVGHEAIARELEAFVQGRPIRGACSLGASETVTVGAEDSRSSKLLAVARDYTTGASLDWRGAVAEGRCASLPAYSWQRERLWPEWMSPEAVSVPPEMSAPSVAVAAVETSETASEFTRELLSVAKTDRIPFVVEKLRSTLRSVLGLPDHVRVGASQPLFELGINSLSWLELRSRIGALVGDSIPATSLFDFPTLAALAQHIVARTLNSDEPVGAKDVPYESLVAKVAGLSDEEAESRLLKEVQGIMEGLR